MNVVIKAHCHTRSCLYDISFAKHFWVVCGLKGAIDRHLAKQGKYIEAYSTKIYTVVEAVRER